MPRGRKTVDDKKIQVQVYIAQSVIDNVGGMDNARSIAIKAIESAPKVKPPKTR